MAHTGDNFIVALTPSQLGWGIERYTNSREKRYGEGYLTIHREFAKALNLFNSNYTNGADVLGQNIFNCQSSDGFLNCQLKSQGSSNSGDKYAKQFAGNDNLRALGAWYANINAKVGDQVEVFFISPTDIRLTLL